MKITILLTSAVFFAAFCVPARADGTLSLSALLKEAREKNPGLSAVKYKYRAALARVPQAGALPDPMLMTGIQNLPVNSFEFDEDMMTSKMIGISQTFPFFGKRALREKAASEEARAVKGDYGED
ncbi:MAG: TolC family protein, partial [Nitrospiraceae bacterium]|nr:TolC family protein [Nitrospiraceae bacterium]